MKSFLNPWIFLITCLEAQEKYVLSGIMSLKILKFGNMKPNLFSKKLRDSKETIVCVGRECIITKALWYNALNLDN